MAFCFVFFTAWISTSLQANSSHTVVSILWWAEQQCKKGGGLQPVSDCLWVDWRLSGCSRRQQQQLQQQLHGFSLPPSNRTPSQTAPPLVIEGTHSCAACLCPHYLCSGLVPCLCSLSWLETGEYGEKCWGCSKLCCPQLLPHRKKHSSDNHHPPKPSCLHISSKPTHRGCSSLIHHPHLEAVWFSY